MKPFAVLMVVLMSGVAHAQEASWDVAVAAGASNASTALPGMQMGSAGTTDELEPTMFFSVRYRISDRVVWSVPTLSFAYLGGEQGTREWIPWGGLTGFGLGYSSLEGLITQGQLGAGIGFREWIGRAVAINATAQTTSDFDYRGDRQCGLAMCESWQGPSAWNVSASIGVTAHLGDSVSFNAGVAAGEVFNSDIERGMKVSVGSVQMIALRQLPLLQAKLSDSWFLDGYASASYERVLDRVEQRYLVGFTRLWAP